MDELERHVVYDNDYFKLLEKTPWNSQTYDFHRANFFQRTEGTVKGIAYVCAQAAANDDRDTLVLFSYILNEEAGNGQAAACHEVLMENAHNRHGQVEFGLPPLLVKEARNSSLVIPETLAYRERTRELIGANYHRMLGVAMALESHADKMLQVCRTAFRNSNNELPKSEFVDNVEIYFNVHVGQEGVEERHAADARKCVLNNCRTEADVAEIAHGATETLNIQLEMWNAMYKAVTS
ncbi:iron-containing redox enzyme family protein [Streptantibioticus ferralitis]|uniref:Iron-containing redox enzyme family protein n=1 Tax=Streptantibioticus ferralitis TaxID=236510 RepID=A0ABT5Z5D4_9ACTN|nr:iron-containing redox enzyme family protein [Streptantibioticus ferralitis]MDF2258958.1 iron-containing redox enzyme family protein [Streptantibioticus ferralitis]